MFLLSNVCARRGRYCYQADNRLFQYTLDQIPIDRLTASDIKQQAGGIAAVVVLVIVLVIIAINQVRVMRVTGWLPYYLGWYILGGVIIAILSQMPGLELRM